MFKNSIKNWSQSDVPISCSLSGGLDSSLISAIFAENSSKKFKQLLSVLMVRVKIMMKDIMPLKCLNF